MTRQERRKLLASHVPRSTVIVLLVIVAVLGLLAGKAWASIEAGGSSLGLGHPAVTTTSTTVDPAVIEAARVQAKAQADAAEAARVEEERRVAARAATEAELTAIGWVAGACEPETPGVPLVGTLPVCEGIYPSIGHWWAINNCEQPPGTGQGWATIGVFGNGLAGGGGLGISNGAWSSWGGGQFASIPAYASIYQQMLVASRGYRQYGPGPWGCKV